MDPRLCIPNYTHSGRNKAKLVTHLRRVFLEVIHPNKYDGHSGTPYPSTLFLELNTKTEKDQLLKIFTPFGKCTVDLSNDRAHGSITFTTQVGNHARKAMLKIFAGKFDCILNAEFDLNGTST